MAKEKFQPDVIRYMLIDKTTVEGAKILLVAPIRHVQLYGAIERANGRDVIAPPLEGRGFSKLDKLTLQYMFWNTFQETPPEEYEELLKLSLEKAKQIPMDLSPLESLEKDVARLYPDGYTFGPREQEAQVRVERKVRSDAGLSERPKTGSSTGAVWDICDELSTPGNPVDRKVAIAKCVEDGINQATASTQYSKWKKNFEAASTEAPTE